MTPRRLIPTFLLLAAIAFPGASWGQSPGTAPPLEGEPPGGPAPQQPAPEREATDESALPDTGFGAGLLAMAGAGLLMAGAGLRLRLPAS